ncbi:DUF397 domain-containing protein [Micromonospora fulviviridis]|uniref:DUF397 domain-containing protein n=1 Tax=Micromonospora fulviviridis TaxID=47860 RepID=UPI0037A26E42
MTQVPTLTFLRDQPRRAQQARGFGREIVAVRDSKDPSGPVLTFDPASWRASVAAAPTSH